MHCAIRTKDGDGPWLPCLRQPVLADPDGALLCVEQLPRGTPPSARPARRRPTRLTTDCCTEERRFSWIICCGRP